MAKGKKKPRNLGRFPYKSACEFCGATAKGNTLFSFFDPKKGAYRAACKKHLKKVK